MVLSEIIDFWNITTFYFEPGTTSIPLTQSDDHPPLGPKNLVLVTLIMPINFYEIWKYRLVWTLSSLTLFKTLCLVIIKTKEISVQTAINAIIPLASWYTLQTSKNQRCYVFRGYRKTKMALNRLMVSQAAFTCSKLTIKTLKQGVIMLKVNKKVTRTTPRSRVFIVNFEHIPHLVLVFVLLTLSINGSQPAFTCSKLTIETLEQGVKYVKS